MSKTRKWPHIDGLHIVIRNLRKWRDVSGTVPPTVSYRPKVKLHGTNAAVRFRDRQVEAFQSRTQDITPDADNCGFAAWASTVDWHVPDGPGKVRVIHGEWAGPGVNRGTAVQAIPGKKFFIFALEFSSDEIDPETGDWRIRTLCTDPEDIASRLGDWSHPDVHIIPWQGIVSIDVDMAVEGEVNSLALKCNRMVESVEASDPYIKEVFGVDGIGEGVVMYPVGFMDREAWGRIAFKAKGEKHRVKAARVAAEVAPEVLASTEAFAAAFVTEARCEQGLGVVCPDGTDIKKTGGFIGWVSKDVKRESATELEDSGLTWKQVGKAVSTAARDWFMQRVRSLT
jgi:hypothetical protein